MPPEAAARVFIARVASVRQTPVHLLSQITHFTPALSDGGNGWSVLTCEAAEMKGGTILL